MVFVGDKKYACETCIKGHRSSSCKHTDRPLFEIKKKGRPVTQCEHCRELRKTRQIHVKCICENKEKEAVEGGSAPAIKGGTKVPDRAAFPSGLPEELLGASAAAQPLSEGSDSDQSSRGCSCKDSASCTCWTPRNRAKRGSKSSDRRSIEVRPGSGPVANPITQPAGLAVHAHIGNHRPVLPRPPNERPGSPSRTSHAPSSAQATGRLPSHGQSLYTPYSRAYDYSHPPEFSLPTHVENLENPPNTSTSPFGAWNVGVDTPLFPPSPISPQICGCGPSCACPGCVEHKGPSADPMAPCTNPDTCVACLDCNINSLAALASGTTRALYDTAGGIQTIDEWLRQASAMSDLPSAMQSGVYPIPQSHPDIRFDASMYGMWNTTGAVGTPSQFSPAVAEECCGGRCKCPTGLCGCPSDCCGCCQGCQCSGCVHDSGTGRTLTFATSGERDAYCGGSCLNEGLPNSGPSIRQRSGFSAGSNVAGPSSGGPLRFDGQWLAPTLAVPREPLSRASSSSSKSSAHPSVSPSTPSPVGDLVDVSQRTSPPDAAAVNSCCTSMGNLNTNITSMPSQSRRRGSDHNEYRTSSNIEYGSRYDPARHM